MYEKGLETFLAVAMSRTLKDASNVLNLSKSTVSYNLKNLEKQLDMELIDRRKGFKTIQLTAAGDALLPLAMKWDEIVREIASMTSSQRHKLSIGCVESLNQCLFPDFYHSLSENITLKITTEHSLELYQMLEDRMLDVAFVVNQVIASNLNVVPFYRERLKVLKLSEDGVDEAGTVNVSELNPRYELFINWSLSYQIWHDHVWPNVSDHHFETDTVRHVDSFLAKGKRYWIIAPESVGDYFQRWGLKAHNIDPEPPERICYKLTHKRPNPSVIHALEEFNMALSKWFGEDAVMP